MIVTLTSIAAVLLAGLAEWLHSEARSGLGIDPDLLVPERTGRPVSINLGGRPIEGILA